MPKVVFMILGFLCQPKTCLEWEFFLRGLAAKASAGRFAFRPFGTVVAFRRLEGVKTDGRTDVSLAHLHTYAEILQSSLYAVGVSLDVAAGRLAPVAFMQT